MRVVTELMEPEHVHCWVRDSISVPATGSGPLDGQTMAVKDMFAVRDWVSSFGLGRWRETHGPSEATAPVIAALLASGASIAGLAKMDQIAWSIVGNVAEGTAPLNSVYPDRFTCGSSSGPASAVAAGLADFGIGSDTGGRRERRPVGRARAGRRSVGGRVARALIAPARHEVLRGRRRALVPLGTRVGS